MSVNKNVLKELEGIVPGFKWPEKQVGLDIPENYFMQLPNVVLGRINGNREKEILPPLSQGSLLRVPVNYFDDLPGKVIGRIQRENQGTPVIRLPRRHRKWPQWATAAAIAAFVALGGLLWLTPPPVRNTGQSGFSLNQQLASISNQAIEQYLRDHINSSNEEEVYDNLSNQELQDALTSELSTSAIEEYLQSNEPDSSPF